MDGILCINKPSDYTSFDVIARLRGILKQKRIGHSGTLDPMATGVLPIFIGKATKATDMLCNHDKTYIAEFMLGLKTDTLDITGKVLDRCEVNVSKEQIAETINSFAGTIEQIPPMYSAVQVNGKRLYDLARQGIEVERKSRTITIYSIDILEIGEDCHCKIEVSCSKGTYIRTLCSDIGENLGCYATLTALQRTVSSGFTLDMCHTIEEIECYVKDGSIQNKLIEVSQVFLDLPKIQLDEVQSRIFINGVKLDINRLIMDKSKSRFSVYSSQSVFLGTATADYDAEELRIEKLFSERM